MLLLTGATGTVGRAILRRLTATQTPVRCLVRDPRRLGPGRVRVQIALGDLGAHLSFRHALRGIDTVVHLASVIRDQPGGSIEELAGVATWRLVQAAERAGVQRFVFFSTLGASTRSRARLMRAKAIAERAVVESTLEHTVFAPSIVYSPSDPYLTLLANMSWLPVMPIPGSGKAAFEPVWAEDVADCTLAALRGGRSAAQSVGARYELAGPETLTHQEIVEIALRSFHRRRAIVKVPIGITRRLLKLVELLGGPHCVCDLGRGRAARGAAGLARRDRRRAAARRGPKADASRARSEVTRLSPGHGIEPQIEHGLELMHQRWTRSPSRAREGQARQGMLGSAGDRQ